MLERLSTRIELEVIDAVPQNSSAAASDFRSLLSREMNMYESHPLRK
jgi:hypothetical protein